jgi:S1-C subfamily serine protease
MMSDKRYVCDGVQLAARVGFMLALLGLAFSLGACNRQNSSTPPSASATPLPIVKTSLTDNGGTATVAVPSYADVASRVAPAVVTIHSQMRVRAPQQYPFTDDPFFRDFFGDRGNPNPPVEQRRSALGSGVIVSADGYILTNHHVIDGAEEIKVDLNDNRTLNAKVVGSDAPSDLAVLKIDAGNLPVLALGDSDRMRVGAVVLATGQYASSFTGAAHLANSLQRRL